MPKCLIALSLAILSAAAQAAPAWTWVDANGRQHFSDRPMPGATRIELPDSRSLSRSPAPQATAPAAAAPRQSAQALPAAATDAAPATVAYASVDIVTPAQEQTLWNLGGTLPVQLELTPALQNGHYIDAILDGQRIRLSALSAQFMIPDVYRGLHTLQAVVIDAASGNEIIRSLTVTFMVQQTSIQNRAN